MLFFPFPCIHIIQHFFAEVAYNDHENVELTATIDIPSPADCDAGIYANGTGSIHIRDIEAIDDLDVEIHLYVIINF